MKKRIYFGFALILAIAVSIAGCGGGGGNNGGGGGNIVYKSFAYVACGNTISIYNINDNGALTAVGAYTVGASARWVAANSAKKCLYIVCYDNTVRTCSIQADGNLSQIGTIPSNASGPMGADICGRNFYISSFSGGSGKVSHYSINADGTLAYQNEISTGADSPDTIIGNPNGNLVYAMLFGNGIAAYDIGSNGALTAHGSTTTVANIRGVAVSPNNQYVYGLVYDTLIYQFKNTPGILTDNGTLHTNFRAKCGVVAGGFLYALDADDAKIWCASINGNGSLGTPITRYVWADSSNAMEYLATDSEGRFLYVLRNQKAQIDAYAITSTGVLNELGSLPTGNLPVNIAIAKVRQ